MRRREDEIATSGGLDAEELGAERSGTGQPDLLRLEQWHRNLQRPDPVHLAAEDAFDPAQHPLPKRKKGVEAARKRKGESGGGEESVRAVRGAEWRKQQLRESHQTSPL